MDRNARHAHVFCLGAFRAFFEKKWRPGLGDAACLCRRVAEAHGGTFAADKTANLVARLRHNVIRAGLRRINLAYSRISLQDVAAKLGAALRPRGHALQLPVFCPRGLHAVCRKRSCTWHSRPQNGDAQLYYRVIASKEPWSCKLQLCSWRRMPGEGEQAVHRGKDHPRCRHPRFARAWRGHPHKGRLLVVRTASQKGCHGAGGAAGLASVEDTECIVAKAIRDGGIDATLDHAARAMSSRETADVYGTPEPAAAFHARVAFCLDIHNEVLA